MILIRYKQVSIYVIPKKIVLSYKRREQGTLNWEEGTDKKHSFAPV
jgi:hypothetical protein